MVFVRSTVLKLTYSEVDAVEARGNYLSLFLGSGRMGNWVENKNGRCFRGFEVV